MLNKQTILEVATSEKNAGDFPKVIAGFKQIGVVKYQFLVQKGIYIFWDASEKKIEAQLNGVPKPVAQEVSTEKIKKAVQQAQAGSIHFEAFIELAGLAGIALWEADLDQMTVTYMNEPLSEVLSEPIPE
ncbi:DUF1398 family protein [Listeria ivanovii]|uniref:DUF1398 family protein n=2 Tax=Listeria ivanovii TaxID=1638 RepID=A0ABS1G2L2_LISIV|nr:DUF1398 family protein [Listeria ivanovii]EFR97900.1 phage envelope protein [Listeria ivanovii FSL F6-596]AIS59028.1 phage envelope protein [Listeria ivanovii subsp. londoniensis]MBC2254685.1 DUF1398 family protein [Listeria ivanovii]MBK1961111.1 DUF1398 family protein [Listeria ivanovii subsp. londoniensis]MBM5607949.1 DUF1398 domain-containing protein [Listeria ivanovii]